MTSAKVDSDNTILNNSEVKPYVDDSQGSSPNIAPIYHKFFARQLQVLVIRLVVYKTIDRLTKTLHNLDL